MNPLAVSQERIQGLVWLVSLIGCYVSAWRLLAHRKRITCEDNTDASAQRGLLIGAAVCLALAGSYTWYYMGAEIIGRIVHPALFVEKHK